MSIDVNKDVNNSLVNFIVDNFKPEENINPTLDFSLFKKFRKNKILTLLDLGIINYDNILDSKKFNILFWYKRKNDSKNPIRNYSNQIIDLIKLYNKRGYDSKVLLGDCSEIFEGNEECLFVDAVELTVYGLCFNNIKNIKRLEDIVYRNTMSENYNISKELISDAEGNEIYSFTNTESKIIEIIIQENIRLRGEEIGFIMNKTGQTISALERMHKDLCEKLRDRNLKDIFYISKKGTKLRIIYDNNKVIFN